MTTLLLLTTLAFLEAGVCLPFPGHHQNTSNNYRRLSDIPQVLHSMGSINEELLALLSLSNEKSNSERNLIDDLTFEEVLSRTTLTTSGKTSQGITLTVNTVSSVDVIWGYILFDNVMYYQKFVTLGEVQQYGDMKNTSILYDDDSVRVGFGLLTQDYIAVFLIDASSINTSDVQTDRFTKYANIGGPTNISLSGNTLEYDIKYTYTVRDCIESPLDITTMYGSFGRNGLEPRLDTVYTQLVQTRPDTLRVACTIDDANVGEQAWALITSKKPTALDSLTNYRDSVILKRIAFERELPSATEDYLQFELHEKHIMLYPDFKYGNLFCVAIGHPVPQINFLKDGILQNTISKSYFGAATVAFLPLEGRDLDETAGTYICTATSGSKTVDGEFKVEKVQRNSYTQQYGYWY